MKQLRIFNRKTEISLYRDVKAVTSLYPDVVKILLLLTFFYLFSFQIDIYF